MPFHSETSVAALADHMKNMHEALAKDLGLGAKEQANIISVVDGEFRQTTERMVERMLMGDDSCQNIAKLLEEGEKYPQLAPLFRGFETTIVASPEKEMTAKFYQNTLADTLLPYFEKPSEAETGFLGALADWMSDMDRRRALETGYSSLEHAGTGILAPSVEQIFGKGDIDKILKDLPSLALSEKTNGFLKDLAGRLFPLSYSDDPEVRDNLIETTFLRHYASGRQTPYDSRKSIRLGVRETRDIACTTQDGTHPWRQAANV